MRHGKSVIESSILSISNELVYTCKNISWPMLKTITNEWSHRNNLSNIFSRPETRRHHFFTNSKIFIITIYGAFSNTTDNNWLKSICWILKQWFSHHSRKQFMCLHVQADNLFSFTIRLDMHSDEWSYQSYSVQIVMMIAFKC